MTYQTWATPLQRLPEHCRICGWNKYVHCQRWTPEEYRDQIPIKCLPEFTKAFHFYVPITMPEFKEYLLRRRRDKTS